MKYMTIEMNKRSYLEQLEKMVPKPDKLLKILKEENEKGTGHEIRWYGLKEWGVELFSFEYCNIKIDSIKYLEEVLYFDHGESRKKSKKIYINKENEFDERDHIINFTGRDMRNSRLEVELNIRFPKNRKQLFTFDDLYLKMLSPEEKRNSEIKNLNTIYGENFNAVKNME